MPTYKHAELNFSLSVSDTLKQIDLERFAKKYREAEKVSGSEERGAICRAAVLAGWIEEPKNWNVDQADPRVVVWAAEKINDHYVSITTVPPE